ncbi:MAG: c-type cytochrome [Polyangiaceae bacterium]
MSRIHLRSNTLVLWLSLSAAVGAASIGVGCSSSDSGGVEESGGASAGKGGKSGGKAGAPAADDAGDSSVGGTDPGTAGDTSTDTGGRGDDTPGAGSGGKVAAGGAEPTGSAGKPSDPGEGGAAGAGEPNTDDAAIQRAKDLIAGLSSVRACPTCHQADYGGIGFWANISPDVATGIGGWTDQQIKNAIHLGKDDEDKVLCNTMERYPFTDSQLDDLVKFLRSLAPVSREITAKCPG